MLTRIPPHPVLHACCGSKILDPWGRGGFAHCDREFGGGSLDELWVFVRRVELSVAAAVAEGFQEAAAKTGIDTIVLDAQGRVQKQANDIDDLISQKVNGIALMPLDSVIAQSWVERMAVPALQPWRSDPKSAIPSHVR